MDTQSTEYYTTSAACIYMGKSPKHDVNQNKVSCRNVQHVEIENTTSPAWVVCCKTLRPVSLCAARLGAPGQ